jgi:ribosomal protein L32E
MMNHRTCGILKKYTTKTRATQVQLEKAKLHDFAKFRQETGIDDKMRRQTVKKEMFKISFENTDVEIDMKTGKGEIISFIKTPIISQA